MENRKLKIWMLSTVCCLLSAMALAIPGDFNADGAVAIADLQIFAASWLTNAVGDLDSDSDTDFADFAIFASHWLEGCDATTAVDAGNASANVYLAGNVTFTLPTVSTVGLTYRVISLPAYGTLYNGVNGAAISSVPYVLDSNSIHYHAHASIDTDVTFTWSASTAPNACGMSGNDTAAASIDVSPPPTAPTATAQSVSAVTHIWQTITLAATDDGTPNPPARLKYIVTSLPTVGQIYDPKSGAGKIDHVPYTLSSWGSAVSYWTTTAGADSFQFAADDCGVSPYGGQSAAATVSVGASANPKDCLSFDGRGTVSIPDGTYLDAVNGWAIDFWIKTRQPYSTLVKKHNAATGYEIKLVAGKPLVEFYAASGTITASLEYSFRVDDGSWHNLGVTACDYSPGWLIQWWVDGDNTTQSAVAGSMPSFDNAEPVILGTVFKNQFDKLRFFTAMTHPGNLTDIIQGLSARTDSGNEQFLGIGAISSVLFRCNEATGTTITDSKTNKVGTFSSADHVAWLPYFDPFMDVSVQQRYR